MRRPDFFEGERAGRLRQLLGGQPSLQVALPNCEWKKEAWRRQTRPSRLLEQDRAVDIAHLIHASDEVSEDPTALECERFQVGHQCVTGDGIEDQ